MDKTFKVIPALDLIDLDKLESLIQAIDDHPLIYGYKIGFSLGLTYGLIRVCKLLQKHTAKPLIYDHQKAATDIPETGELFADVMKFSGITEVIIFPLAGPETLKAWIDALQDKALKVIVGGIMTHPGFLESEGGFIRDLAAIKIYQQAFDKNVRDFVVPLTKPEITKKIYSEVGLDDTCTFYSPGYGKQGGNLANFSYIKSHYLIIGRSLLNVEDPALYLDEVSKQINLLNKFNRGKNEKA
ncbi:MAG: orotidine 5'-phosphate decarboxylase [Candidatus Marinimicrobia bacterium]|nr:orotidine 5'-phosphate decarboxylase [Candidatus Neomarinimicrobiota bacterium]MDD5582136.1 orotidine 5'-phosphate decarboxylase [Candidatus Neomarinimicrobiota bacterium]